MKKVSLLTILLLCLFVTLLPVPLQGQKEAVSESDTSLVFSEDSASPPLEQVIIKFDDTAAANQLLLNENDGSLPILSDAAGVTIRYVRPMALDAHVLGLPEAMPHKEVALIAAALSQVEGVQYAEPDRILSIAADGPPTPFTPELTPNDTRWNDMWHLRYTPNTSEGINVAPAWDITTGLPSTVVAVIDTGILPHNDLAGKTVPGYDFISNIAVANDGNGRDSNPTDPGDWIVANECYAGSPARTSSWHGTHVAGTIGAATNNNLGIAGVNWNAKILPLRVLGKCGGLISDITDAMVWAAGISVTGVPNNSNPAKVLNLSLGGPGACSTTEQNAINAIVSAGSTIVVAAGNFNVNASGYSPGNCNNVITVAATNRNGQKASYSNFGSIVEISAPGGETNVASNGVLSTLDSGTTTANNSHTYTYYQGTSMAAPHVSGVASLVLALRPSFTPAQMVSHLRTTARAFPAGSSCNVTNCGSGIVDAYRALFPLTITPTNFVYLPLMTKAVPPPPVNPIVNPGFESGATGWTQYSTHGWTLILNSGYPTGVTPHGGSWLVWLGGDYDEISYIQQQVTVPASTPYLSYWHWIASQDSCGYDFGGVLVNGTVVSVYNLCSSQNTGGWVKHVVNLSAYANQSVTLQIRTEMDSSLNSNLFVDDVAFQATAAVNEAPFVSEVGWGETTASRFEVMP